jgi:hypothetical protein
LREEPRGRMARRLGIAASEPAVVLGAVRRAKDAF